MNNKFFFLTFVSFLIYGCGNTSEEAPAAEEAAPAAEEAAPAVEEAAPAVEEAAPAVEEADDILGSEGSSADLLSAQEDSDENRYYLGWEPCSGKLSFEVSKEEKNDLLSDPLVQLYRTSDNKEESNFVEVMRGDGYSPIAKITIPMEDGETSLFEFSDGSSSGTLTRYGEKIIFSSEDSASIESSIECGLWGVEKITTENILENEIDNHNWGHLNGNIEMDFHYGWKPLGSGNGEFVRILAKIDIISDTGDIAVAMFNYGAPEGMCPVLTCEGDVHTLKVMDKYRKVLRTYKFNFPYEENMDLRKADKVQAELLDSFGRPKVTYYISYEKYRSIISSWIQPKYWSNEVFLKE